MRIFVSYARSDRDEVDRMVSDLAHLGHDVWFDEQLLGGTDWWAEILRRIRAADVLVFALSPSSINSLACLSELQYADETRRRFLPVMVRWVSPTVLPTTLSHAQFVDYTSSGWKGLSAALVKMPPAPPLPDPLPPTPSPPESALTGLRRRVLAPQHLARGEQHEMIDDIVREGRHAGQTAAAYDVLEALGKRPDLLADVSGRVQSSLQELWTSIPSAERGSRPGPWAQVPAWAWAYVIGICALSFVTIGLVPLVIGLRNRNRPLRRLQAWIMIVVAVGYFVLLIALMVVSSSPEQPS